MATEGTPEETTITDEGTVILPPSVRRRLDIEAGDKLRWNVTEDGELTVEVVQQRYGAFADDELKADFGGDSLTTHDIAGSEAEFAEDCRAVSFLAKDG